MCEDFEKSRVLHRNGSSLSVGQVARVCFSRLRSFKMNYGDVALCVNDLFSHKGTKESGYQITWLDFLQYAATSSYRAKSVASKGASGESYGGYSPSTIRDSSCPKGRIVNSNANRNQIILSDELSSGLKIFRLARDELSLSNVLPLPSSLSGEVCTMSAWNDGEGSVAALVKKKAICVWDMFGSLPTCRVKAVIPTEEFSSGIWASSLLGNRYVTASHGRGSLFVFDSSTQSLVSTLQGHKGAPTCLVDCLNLVASSSMDRTISLWDPSSCSRVLQFSDSHMGVNSLLFSKNCGVLISGCGGGVIRVNSEDSQYLVKKLSEHKSPITGLQSLPAQPDHFMSVDESGVVKIWDSRMWRCMQTIPPDPVKSFTSVLGVGDYLVKVGQKRLSIWSLSKSSSPGSKQKRTIVSIQVNMRRFVFLIAFENAIKVCDIPDGALKCEWDVQGVITSMRQEESEQRTFAIHLLSGEILVLDAYSGKSLCTTAPQFAGNRRPLGFEFVNQETLAVFCNDGSLCLVTDGAVVKRTSIAANPVAVSRFGTQFVVMHLGAKMTRINLHKSTLSSNEPVAVAQESNNFKLACLIDDGYLLLVLDDESLLKIDSSSGQILANRNSFVDSRVELTAICYYHASSTEAVLALSEPESNMLTASEKFFLADTGIESVLNSLLDEQRARTTAHESICDSPLAASSPKPRPLTVQASSAKSTVLLADSMGRIHVLDPNTLDTIATIVTSKGFIQSLHIVRGVEGVIAVHIEGPTISIFSFRNEQQWGQIVFEENYPRTVGSFASFPLKQGNPIFKVVARRIASLVLPEDEVEEAFKSMSQQTRLLSKLNMYRDKSMVPIQRPHRATSEQGPGGVSSQSVTLTTTPRSLKPAFLMQELLPLKLNSGE